jgi:hypothetical protein
MMLRQEIIASFQRDKGRVILEILCERENNWTQTPSYIFEKFRANFVRADHAGFVCDDSESSA